MDELNNNINEYFTKGRALAESLTLKGRADLDSLRRKTADAAKQLMRLKDRSPIERKLTDERYAVLERARSACGALKNAKRTRCASGAPLVLLFAREYLRECAWRAESDSFEAYLSGFQCIHPLEYGELWLLSEVFAALITLRLSHLASKGGSPGEAEDCLSSLRALAPRKLKRVLRAQDMLDKALMTDPAGVYPKMTRQSKNEYCALLCRLARKNHLSELDAAQTALDLAKKGEGAKGHVGWYIVTMPLGERERNYASLVTATVFLGTLILTSAVAVLACSPLSVFFTVLPLWTLWRSVVHSFVKRAVAPRAVPCLDYSKQVPREGKTLCAVSCLLTDEKTSQNLVKKLEELKLSNPECGENVIWALLADLPDSDEPQREEDERLIRFAAKETDRLNELHSGGFMLFTRQKMFSRREGKYIAPERKRGAIEELVGFLTSSPSAIQAAAGEPSQLADTKYVLALDSDTVPLPGSISSLIGTLSHPLAEPVIERGRVVRGWAVAVPRQEVCLEDSVKTPFARAFAGSGGWDSYAPADVRSLIAHRSGFGGKGLINIAAYKQCLWGRIPRGRVLSHDLLEGEYLSTLYVKNALFTDGFPACAIPYYARLHRWTRGDWQCLPWVRGKVPVPGGVRHNPLYYPSRLRILENVLRSLALPSAFVITVLAAFGAVSGLLALFCLIPVLDDVFSSVKALFLSLRGGRRSLEYALERLGAAFLKLSLLANESFVCLSAAITALVRMAFTRRHMLQWITAAQAERSESTFDAYIKKMFFSILSGAAVIAAAQNVWFFALGFVWLISPLTAYLYSRPRKKAKALDKSKTDWLLSQAKMMAAYYEDTMTEKTGWLPPDNVQLKPWKGTAMRTSPTNIGLALLAIVSANILGLWDDDKAAELIDRCLKTVLKLEKWQGHLYNWYSLVTLEPLAPGDISSVDSGNLCACLVAVKEAMRTLKSPEAESAALAAEQLIEQMDFSPLYDREQSLLKVFVRPGENVCSGCYDLLASEARLAYFTSVALGKADKRIWHALSRASSKAGGLRPLVSWSGTMFEYLMPRLLLTEYDGSLLDRSGKDCVKVQRSAAGKDGLWGISESCYYSFDETLDYRYKAHGVQALALSRCRSGEKVISPYSSFLALETAPGAAAENLMRLESVGAGGEWGLCEAVDLTPSRGARGRGAVVSCFMAHHLGMSLASVCNYLTDGALRRLFLSDSRIRAWQILLKERAQTVCNAAEPGVSYDVLPGRHKVRPPISDDGLGLAMQDCCLLSNGLFSFVSDRTGRQSIRCGGAEVTEGAIVWTLTDGESEYTVTPLDAFEAEHSSVFSSDSCVFTLCKNGLECSLETAVVHSRAGLVQKLTVKNKSSQSRTVTVRAEFTPVLENAAAYYSHPAFSKLFLNAKQTGSGVTVQRRKREGGHSACLHARLSRPGAKTELERRGRNGDQAAGECCVSFEVTLAVGQESLQELKLSLCMADTVPAAEEGAHYCLERGFDERSDREREFSSLPGTELFDSGCALELLRQLQWRKDRGALGSREELYLHGISGDLPIASADANGEDVSRLLLANRYLAFASRPFDLVLFLKNEGYLKPEHNALMGKMRETDSLARLSVRGGVHLAGLERKRVISSLSSALWPLETIEPSLPDKIKPKCLSKGSLSFKVKNEIAELTLKNSLPRAVWSVPLANESFGTLAADCGFMGCWYKNARENRLTPWVNDPLAIEGSEKLEILTEDGAVSAFADFDCWDTKVTFTPGKVSWIKTKGEKKIITEAFVMPDVSAKVITVKTEGLSGASGVYTTRIIMGSALDTGEHTLYTPTVGGIEAINLYNGDFKGQHALILGERVSADEKGITLTFDTGEPKRIVLGCFMTSREERAIRALAASDSDMEEFCPGPVIIKTPAPQIDNYVNYWALYQTKVCRLWARCSVYQCGGAYGFRDQLQDICALLWSDAHLAREHILKACSKQFAEGDCAHWWHELSDSASKGVRTRCSDDLLWLAYAAALYVEATGDKSLLDEKVCYLSSPPLKNGENDRYGPLISSDKTGSVYEHCLKAIDCFLSRGAGEHHLPLMLSGDWNDGMDSVGDQGRGESVWLAWFGAMVLKLFAPYCPEKDKERLLAAAHRLEEAARDAWDGQWYLRGYFDSGAPLGSKDSPECQIDAIAQGFAALAGVTDDKTRTALKSACKLLIKPRAVALFTPPFEGRGEFPGYISAYPGGIRENGGQYTHGAIWLAMGCLRAGLKEEGLGILKSIAPKGVYDERYGAEPFVIAADVSLKEGIEGKAGWTWYTGSSGWFYRAVLEELLGLSLKNGVVTWDASRLPPGWSEKNVSITVKGKPLRPGQSVSLDQGHLQSQVRRRGGNLPPEKIF